ncbi:MAG: hypothetical protein SFU27_09340 [Thermonemataceae bacterium]|nr:hypothetical protein [Thermonemataceae bacterium]
MKQIVIKTLAFFLLLVIFIANNSFVLVKHSCKMKGEQTFLFAPPNQTCCTETANEKVCSKPKISAYACCIETFEIQKLSIDLRSFQFLSFSFALPIPLFTFSFSNPLFIIPKIKFSPKYAKPPPLVVFGKVLRQHICSYLI